MEVYRVDHPYLRVWQFQCPDCHIPSQFHSTVRIATVESIKHAKKWHDKELTEKDIHEARRN